MNEDSAMRTASVAALMWFLDEAELAEEFLASCRTGIDVTAVSASLAQGALIGLGAKKDLVVPQPKLRELIEFCEGLTSETVA